MAQRHNTSEPLNHIIGVRVSQLFYNKLEELRKNSNCRTIGEFARCILMEEKIIWYKKDLALEALAVELTGIRRELKSIGNNVNQVTRYFNGTSIPDKKIYEALNLLDEFKKVHEPVSRMILLYDDLSKKW